MRRLLTVAILFLLAPLAYAQTVGNASCSSTTGTSLGIQFPNSNTAGSTYIVWLAWYWNGTSTNTLASVADGTNGDNFYNIGSPVDSVINGYGLEAWYAFNTSASPNAKATITLTINSSQAMTMCIAEVTGLANPYPLDKFAQIYVALSGYTGWGTAGTLAGATTAQTRDANELVVGMGFANSGPISAGTGFACNVGNGTGTNGCTSAHYMIESKTVSSSGTQEATFSSGSSSDTGTFFTLTFRESGSTISGLYWVQGNASNDLTNSLTAAVSLAVSPSVETGNHLVVVTYWNYFSAGSCPTVSSVLDGNSNSYTAGGTSTCNGGVRLNQFYRLLTPANATGTVTATFANTDGNYTDTLAAIDDFYYPSGTVVADGTANTTPNVFCATTGGPNYLCTGPSITATAGDMIYASWIVPDNGANAPPLYPGQVVTSPWIGTNAAMSYTGVMTGLNNGQWTASGSYIPSSPGGAQTPEWYTSYSGDDFNVGITAFKFTASGGSSSHSGQSIIF
jgi:hypothetical protein